MEYLLDLLGFAHVFWVVEILLLALRIGTFPEPIDEMLSVQLRALKLLANCVVFEIILFLPAFRKCLVHCASASNFRCAICGKMVSWFKVSANSSRRKKQSISLGTSTSSGFMRTIWVMVVASAWGASSSGGLKRMGGLVYKREFLCPLPCCEVSSCLIKFYW